MFTVQEDDNTSSMALPQLINYGVLMNCRYGPAKVKTLNSITVFLQLYFIFISFIKIHGILQKFHNDTLLFTCSIVHTSKCEYEQEIVNRNWGATKHIQFVNIFRFSIILYTKHTV